MCGKKKLSEMIRFCLARRFDLPAMLDLPPSLAYFIQSNRKEGQLVRASMKMMEQPEKFDRIEVNPTVLSEQPVVKGTRLPVYMIVESIAAGDRMEDLLEAYPYLSKEDVQQALLFAAQLSRAGLEVI